MLQSATKEVPEARRLGKEHDTALYDYIHQLEEIINMGSVIKTVMNTAFIA